MQSFACNVDKTTHSIYFILVAPASKYPVKTNWIEADFSHGGNEIYERIERELAGIPVGVLGRSDIRAQMHAIH